MTDIRVAHIDELTEGQLTERQAGETKILLTRIGDDVFAVGALCPHYQAPLANGLLCGKRLYCPWHHSAFDMSSGNLLEPPSIDGLPTYLVRLDNGGVWVSLPDSPTPKPAPTVNPKDTDQTVVILGAGAAGYFAAQTLREQDFSGRIILISGEEQLPYDRPKLSKNYLAGKAPADKVPLREAAYFDKMGIDLQTGTAIERIDTEAKQLVFKGGKSLTYNQLIVATGSNPQTLSVPGTDLPGVVTLRSFDDADKLLARVAGKPKVVVVGSSFIGLEVAASLRQRDMAVTVVAPENLPFEHLLGPEIGAMFKHLHEANGVTFHVGANVAAVEGNGLVEAVRLDDGERIPADLVVVGIGVTPNTAFLEGIPLAEKDHSIPVDTYLKAADGLYAAGDIAQFPDPRNNNIPTRIEHWRTAQQHGRTAAMNVLGQANSVGDLVPFFWTNQYDKRLSYVGHAPDWDDLLINGDVAAQTFLAFYAKEGRVLAVASMNRDQESVAIEELMRRNMMPTLAEIKQQLPDFKMLV